MTSLGFEKGSILKGLRPFLKMEFRRSGKKITYNFAAFGTSCTSPTAAEADLIRWQGSGLCGIQNNGATKLTWPSAASKANEIPTWVPRGWEQDLKLVVRTVDGARGGSSGGGKP